MSLIEVHSDKVTEREAEKEISQDIELPTRRVR